MRRPSRSSLGLSMVLVAISLGVGCTGNGTSDDVGASPTTGAVPVTTATRELCGRQLGRSALEIEGDFDGDGRADRAYEDGEPLVLGVCLADGRSDEVGIGQAEGAFSASDLDGDGRDEIIYGATSATQQIDVLAAVRDGHLELGSGDDPALHTGPLGDDVHSGQAWGCEAADRDGRREAIQVTVRQRGAEATWVKERFRVDAALLVPLGQTSGVAPSAGDPTQQADVMTGRC